MTAPRSVPSLTLDRPLALALTSAPPGAALPPGPRANAWHRAGAVQGDPGAALLHLADALWHRGAPHRAPDGTVTSIRRRPVPSAGACYPVQTHLVAGGARWAYDHEQGIARRRDHAVEHAAGWPAGDEPSDAATLVFTVQPGRSFGRYRHRAWPLWIADAAYALAAVEFLLDVPPAAVRFGPSAQLRALLGVPAASCTAAWTELGLAPELPLVAVDLPVRPEPDRTAVAALARRRSPSHEVFLARAASRRPPRRIERIARRSGQSWVRGAASVRSWSAPAASTPTQLCLALWRGHLAAARLSYAAAMRGVGTRAVSGLPAQGGRWTFHALAFLDSPGDRP